MVLEQPDAIPALAQDVVGDAPVVAVLVDEALPLAVDEYALYQGTRRVPGDGGEALAHIQHRAADACAEQNTGAVVDGSQGEVRAQQERGVLLHHLPVHDKAPGAQHHRTPRTRIACFAVDAQHKAVHVTAAVGNECQRACVIQNPHVSFDDALRQHVHDIAPAAHAEELRTVPARCRPRTLDERPRLLAPRPDQAVIRRGLDAALGNVGVLVFDALCGEPLEMLEGAVRIAARLRGIRIRAAGHQQVLIKVLRRIRKTCGALDRRAPAAAEVDLAARKRRGAPVTPGTLHQQHAGPAARGLERGTRAGGTEADDDHITFVVPVADPLQRRRMT